MRIPERVISQSSCLSFPFSPTPFFFPFDLSHVFFFVLIPIILLLTLFYSLKTILDSLARAFKDASILFSSTLSLHLFVIFRTYFRLIHDFFPSSFLSPFDVPASIVFLLAFGSFLRYNIDFLPFYSVIRFTL